MAYESLTLGLKGTIRLHQLTGRDVVVVTCPQCHKVWNVAPHVLYDRYHEMITVDGISDDFKCRKCDHGDRMHWYLMRAIGPEFPRSV